jgi:hypothetical protein
MPIKEKLENDLKEAMKSGDNFRRETLRFVLSILKNKEIEKRGKGKDESLKEEEILEILSKEAEKRKETALVYKGAGREDLAKKEEREAEIIESYLPARMSDEDLKKEIKEILSSFDEASQKDFGKIMKEAIKRLKGKASSSRISQILKDLI